MKWNEWLCMVSKIKSRSSPPEVSFGKSSENKQPIYRRAITKYVWKTYFVLETLPILINSRPVLLLKIFKFQVYFVDWIPVLLYLYNTVKTFSHLPSALCYYLTKREGFKYKYCTYIYIYIYIYIQYLYLIETIINDTWNYY